MADKIKLGISSCLLGEEVRYDGQHKLDRYLRDTLGQFVEYVPVCPEYELGLGVPRETLHLEGDPANPRLVFTKSGKDITHDMKSWSVERLNALEREGLCGFVFKSGSPSSGMERVKVTNEKGMPERKGAGIFARAFMDRFPLLPVEDEGRLHDPGLRENFITRIFTLKRWRDTVAPDPTRGNLVAFHTRHKFMLQAHEEKGARALSRLVAHAKEMDPGELYDAYLAGLMRTLKKRATVRRHTNVLQHMMGYFKKQLTADEKQELLDVITRYHDELMPLIVPVTLLNHYVLKYDQDYLRGQVYLNPHPIELKLRNHV